MRLTYYLGFIGDESLENVLLFNVQYFYIILFNIVMFINNFNK